VRSTTSSSVDALKYRSGDQRARASGRNLEDPPADLEQAAQLGRISGAAHALAEHRTWHSEFPGDGIGLAFGDLTVTVLGGEKVVTLLVGHGEPLSDRRLVGVHFY
jgi:hypothetical protein